MHRLRDRTKQSRTRLSREPCPTWWFLRNFPEPLGAREMGCTPPLGKNKHQTAIGACRDCQLNAGDWSNLCCHSSIQSQVWNFSWLKFPVSPAARRKKPLGSSRREETNSGHTCDRPGPASLVLAYTPQIHGCMRILRNHRRRKFKKKNSNNVHFFVHVSTREAFRVRRPRYPRLRRHHV